MTMTPAAMTAKIARDAAKVSMELAYFSVIHEEQLRILFIRPWGRRGQGIWVRRVSEGPAISPPWPLTAEEATCP